MLRKIIYLLILIFSISTYSEENITTKNLILRSIPVGTTAKVYSNSSEIYKGITPVEINLETGIYSIVMSKKGFLDKKINIYIDSNQVFNQEIILEYDATSLSKLDKESIKRDKNKKIVSIPKDSVILESVEEKIEKLNKEKPQKNPDLTETKLEIVKKDIPEISKPIIKEENKEEEIPQKKEAKYSIAPEKKLGDINISGLTWDGSANKLSLSKEEAESYCKGLNKRLPTGKELTSSWKELKDYGWFWTSSVSTNPPGKVIIVSLYTGEIINFESNDVKAYVRCVK